ncbi:MAG: amidohydrolase family protein, partial [Chloroflexota bacterium]|nr:amidohydrolase family protein [Chloroflexota bacterium]
GAGAVAGGVTTVVEMPQASPTTVTAEQFRAKVARIEAAAIADMALWGGVIGEPAQPEADILALAEAGAAGFKSFMASSSRSFPRVDTAQMLGAMRTIAGLGLPYGIHAEDDALVLAGIARMRAGGRTDPLAHAESRPPLVEEVAVATALALADETGCHVHLCHVASARALAMASGARWRGVRVTVETCPQYLVMDTGDLERLAGFARCAPALRDPDEVAAIWDAVLDGTVDLIASDHCGYTVEDKAAGGKDIFAAPMGLPGVQTLLPSMFDAAVVQRGLPVPRLVEMLCANPARVFGLYPRKGAIAVGSDADLVLFDPAETWTVRDEELHHRQRWTPLAGRTLTGRVTRTIRRGETVYDGTVAYDRRVLAAPGSGGFLARGYGVSG